MPTMSSVPCGHCSCTMKLAPGKRLDIWVNRLLQRRFIGDVQHDSAGIAFVDNRFAVHFQNSRIFHA